MSIAKLVLAALLAGGLSVSMIGCASFEEAGEEVDKGVEEIADGIEEAGDKIEEETDSLA